MSLRQALIRNGVTWALILVGFVVVYLFVPDLPDAVLGAATAFAAGGFAYLAYGSFRERHWPLAQSFVVVLVGIALMAGVRLLT